MSAESEAANPESVVILVNDGNDVQMPTAVWMEYASRANGYKAARGSAEQRIAAALPVVANGIAGAIPPEEALRWVQNILTRPKPEAAR